MKRLIVIAGFLFYLVGYAQAAKQADSNTESQAAQKALASGDYRTAYARYARLAASNPLAQFTLGLFEQNGWGRKPNPVAACAWFEKAAQKRIPAAEHFWGDCLAQGTGHSADIAAAVGWYEKAASHGHFISWCSAAEHYLTGQGIPQDVKKGLALCTQAAQANSPPAMLWLARHYLEGGAVKQDLAAARYWYQQAAERQVAEAQYRLGLMLAEGQGGESDLNAALFWLETAAADGYASAYLPTAILYANASVQPDTGALAPEHLAKIYLWLAAAKARNADPGQGEEIRRIEVQVLAVMPEGWRPDLDKKVATHLAQFPH